MNPQNISRRTHRMAVAAFFFLAGICFASWASRIPDLKQKLALNEGLLGLVLFALPIGSIISLGFSGWLIHKFGSRKVIILVAICYPSALITIGLTGSIGQLVTVLFFFGLIGNLYNIAVNTQAVAVENLYGRSIMASFHGIWSMAGFTGAALGTLMVSMNNSPEIHFCLVGVLVIATVLLVKGFLVQKDRADTNQPFFTLPDRFLFKLGLIAFSCMICEGTMFDWSGVYFQKVVAVPKAYTTLGYAAFMATMATGRFIGDYIATRLGKQRVLQGSGVLIATGLLLAVILPTISFATIGFLLVGFGVSSVVPLVYSSAGKSSALSPGMALTAVSSIGFLGFLLGPPMIGFIAQSFGLRWSFTVIAFLGLCTTVVASLINWEE